MIAALLVFASAILLGVLLRVVVPERGGVPLITPLWPGMLFGWTRREAIYDTEAFVPTGSPATAINVFHGLVPYQRDPVPAGAQVVRGPFPGGKDRASGWAVVKLADGTRKIVDHHYSPWLGAVTFVAGVSAVWAYMRGAK